MIVVIDTNALLQAAAHSNPARPILEAWFHGEFTWAVSTEILLEYREIIEAHGGQARWQRVSAMMDFVQAIRPGSFHHVSPTYRFQTIPACPDDDKFAYCAITAAVDWIITEDRHFQALSGSGYKPQPITPEEFIARYRGVHV